MRGHRRCGANDPARGGGGGITRWCGTQQQRQGATIRCRKREPSHYDALDTSDAHFPNHRVDSAAAQCLFHRPEQVAAMRDGNHHQSFRREAQGVEAGAMQDAAFGERHVLDDPEQAGRGNCKRRQPQSKSGCCGEMSLPRCRNFVQCAAYEAAAKHSIDDGNAEGQDPRTGRDPGCRLQSQKTLAKLLDHS